jgi:hypothetical protein
MMDGEMLDTLLARVRIAHHIPGRIRLKLTGMAGAAGVNLIGDLTGAREMLARFSAALGDTPGIRAVRLNPMARSCTVEYDVHALPDKAWNELFSGVPFSGVSSPRAHALGEALSRSCREALRERA